MALKINDECISCGACINECPVEAIFEGADHTEIDAAKCVLCEGHFSSPQCKDQCTVDAIS
jgi:ferredoxin